jgi:hypothetical protein
MIIRPHPNARSPSRCLVICFFTLTFVYLILGNIITNYENQSECYKILKVMDQKHGQVSSLTRATLGGS